MATKPPNRSRHSEQISDWENEGGAPQLGTQNDGDRLTGLAVEEEHILRCLGAAVIAQWNDLPTDIQRKLFRHAVSGDASHRTIRLKEQIARFLHDHKK
jgi:hypothetical protein